MAWADFMTAHEFLAIYVPGVDLEQAWENANGFIDACVAAGVIRRLPALSLKFCDPVA